MRIIFVFVAFAWALPTTLVEHQNLMVKEGICEANWSSLGQERQLPVEDGMTVWLVPCANWALNFQYTAFVEIPDPAAESKFKQLFFVEEDPYLGLHGEPVIQNPVWKSPQLQGHQYFQSNSDCGAAASYDWNPGRQTFVLNRLLLNDHCRTAGPWRQVYP